MERRVREINRQYARRKRWHKIWSMMAALAAFCTTYVLILPAITMSRQLVCEQTEHKHTEICYTQQSALICGREEVEGHSHIGDCYLQQSIWTCGLEENDVHSHSEDCSGVEQVLQCELPEVETHIHSESCYEAQEILSCSLVECEPHTHSETCSGVEQVLQCKLPEVENHIHSETCYALQDVLSCTAEEHTHSEFCYDIGPADANADVETQEDWERSISSVELSGNRAEDVIAVAMSQLGYQESSRNYVLIDELTLNGYTRYGGWYGNPYGDWDAMFASFVLHYAGVDDLGQAEDPTAWAQQIAQEVPQRYRTAGEYDPGTGDLVFFDRDQDGAIDSVGILIAASEDTWQVIEGDTDDAVALVSYAPGDGRIAAYGLIEESTEDPAEAVEYTITYVANNGTEQTLQQQVTGPVTLGWEGLTAPEGMTFSGWNTAPDGSGIAYDEGVELSLTEDMMLYAQWMEENFDWSYFAGDIRSWSTSTGNIGLAKQIEWTGENSDDYSYRLHLTLDGSSLSAGSVTTVEPTEKRNIGIILDVTETMLSTWSGSTSGENKFDAVRALLEGADGFLDSILDGNTYVSVIVVGGQSGYATYEDLSEQIAAGDSMDDFSNINNSLHKAQGISYVTGLKAAEKYLGNDIDSLVYIVGNAPDTYIKYSDGTLDRGTTGTQAQTKNYNDYVTFMENHPDLSMYMVGITPVERGADVAQKMGDYSVNRGTGGGYYEAGDEAELKEKLEQIAEQIVVPADKVTGITIQDPLSEYVTLKGGGSVTATLVKLDSDGNTTSTTDITDQVSITDGVLTCTYTEEIEGPFKIEIGFDIQLAEGVYQIAESGYPHTGDANTDRVTSTSSGKAGFYSNEEATASYNLNGSDTATTSDFPHPVVQAPEKATIQLTKSWVNAADGDEQPVTVELHRGAADGELVGTVVLNQENSWTASCDVKILTAEGTSNQIYVIEQAVEGFTTSYSADNVTVAANEIHPITVTNTKTVVEKTAKLTVNKLWQSVPGEQEAVIHVCTYDGVNDYKDIDGSPFTVPNSGEGTKTFTITWTGETQPVICVYEEHSDAFYPVLTGDGAEKNIPLGGYQLSAMQLTAEADNEYLVTLTNMSSVQMPETGGPGTQAYVFSGLVLIFSALLLMQIQKRKTERRAHEASFR